MLVENRNDEKLIPGLEKELEDVAHYLGGFSFVDTSRTERASIRLLVLKHVWWQNRLFCRMKQRLVVVLLQLERMMALRSLHDELRH